MFNRKKNPASSKRNEVSSPQISNELNKILTSSEEIKSVSSKKIPDPSSNQIETLKNSEEKKSESPIYAINSSLSLFEISLITEELKFRINSLRNIKKTLSNISSNLIKVIEQTSRDACTRLNHQISNYINLLTSKTSFSSRTPEHQSLLTTDLLPKSPNPESLLQDLQIFYTQSMFDLTESTSKSSQKKNFKFLNSHNGDLRCLSISKDEKLLITGSEDTTVRFWDLSKQIQIAMLAEHKGTVRCLALSEDSSLVASGSDDKTVILWNVKEKKSVKVLKGFSSGVLNVEIFNDGKLVVCGSFSGELMVWDLENGKEVKRTVVGKPIFCGVIASMNLYLLGTGNFLEVWDMINFNVIYEIHAHFLPIRSVARTHFKNLAITGSSDKTIKIWDLFTRSEIGVLLGHNQEVRTVVVTQDDSLIISGSSDNKILIWNLQQKSKIHELSIHSSSINHLKITSKMIISVSSDSRLGFSHLSSKTLSHYISLTPFKFKSEFISSNLVSLVV